MICYYRIYILVKIIITEFSKTTHLPPEIILKF